MALSLLETFRTLAAFSPPRGSLKDAPWETYVDWAIGQGLAPLASYNLEYRLMGADAPEWARDRLLSVYQGSVNDNVMKLVNFKRSVTDLQGRKIVVLGGAAFADSLYPHIAFRPVLDIQLLLAPQDLEGLTGFLGQSEFKTAPVLAEQTGATRVLNDGRTPVLLHTSLLGKGYEAPERALFERAAPMRVYGPSLYRLELEDAVVAQCLEHAEAGYNVPMLSFVDLRELILGAPHVSGPYSRQVDSGKIQERAKLWRMERALYTSLGIVEGLFPETREVVQSLKPPLRRASRELLDRLVVGPVTQLKAVRPKRGAERLRRLLAGGRQVLRPLESTS